jgi:cyclohexadienyl dehydratase
MLLRRKTGAMKRSVFVAAAGACLVPLRLRAQTAAPPGRLAAIRAAGVLRAGATGDYKPFTFLAPDGTWSGFDIDSATALAHALGVQLRLVKTTWPTLTADVLAGAFDLAIGGVSVSPERAAAGLLSDPYCRDGKVALIRRADAGKYRALRDLDVPETRVAVNPGGTNFAFVSGYIRHAKVTEVAANLAIAPMVAAGTYDVMFTDGIEAVYDVRVDPRLTVMNLATPFTSIAKVYYAAKGAEDLVAFVDGWLAAREADGTETALREKYFGSNANAPTVSASFAARASASAAS